MVQRIPQSTTSQPMTGAADSAPTAQQGVAVADSQGGLAQQTGVNPHEESHGVAVQFRNRPNADKIPCPALVALYNNGELRPDTQGNVTRENLDQALSGIGINSTVRKILVDGADGTDKIPERFNLFQLRDSNLDHTGSTGVRDPAVRPERMAQLEQFAENGRFYSKNLARAANHFHSQDPGLKGTSIQTLEFSIILETFGRLDANGDRYLSVDDVRGLWLEGRYPKGFSPRSEADPVGLGDLTSTATGMGLRRLWDGFLGLFR